MLEKTFKITKSNRQLNTTIQIMKQKLAAPSLLPRSHCFLKVKDVLTFHRASTHPFFWGGGIT